MSTSVPLYAQLINLFAAVILLLSFAMLAQRRVLQLVDLFALQGFALFLSTLVMAFKTGQHHLFYSAGLTLMLITLFFNILGHVLRRRSREAY